MIAHEQVARAFLVEAVKLLDERVPAWRVESVTARRIFLAGAIWWAAKGSTVEWTPREVDRSIAWALVAEGLDDEPSAEARVFRPGRGVGS